MNLRADHMRVSDFNILVGDGPGPDDLGGIR